MSNYSSIKRLLLGVAVAAAIAGCHDSNRSSSTPAVVPTAAPAVTAEVPMTASGSVSDFISYLKSLVAAVADTLEPVDVSKVTPKADDTIEPTAVN